MIEVYSQEFLQSIPVGIRNVIDKRIKRVSEACLANKLQSSAPHPAKYVNFANSITNLDSKGFAELSENDASINAEIEIIITMYKHCQ